MSEGVYSRRARRTHSEIEPHFFKLSILDRYRDDPNYHVTDSIVSANDGALGSSLQQYVLGRSRGGTPCIVVILAHLCDLSATDQEYWRVHELDADESKPARIEERYKKPMFDGEWPDAISAFEAIFIYLREIDRVFRPDVLFPNFEGDFPDFLTPLSYNSQKAMARFAQDLGSLTPIRLATLKVRISDPERRKEFTQCVEKGRSRDALKLFFTEHALMSNELEEAIAAFKALNEWRNKSAHKLIPAKADQDYFDVQSQLVGRLQRGLKHMMVAFAMAEKGTTDVLWDAAMSYQVDQGNSRNSVASFGASR